VKVRRISDTNSGTQRRSRGFVYPYVLYPSLPNSIQHQHGHTPPPSVELEASFSPMVLRSHDRVTLISDPMTGSCSIVT